MYSQISDMAFFVQLTTPSGNRCQPFYSLANPIKLIAIKMKNHTDQGRIVTWDLPGNKIAARSAKNFFVPGSA